MTLSKRGFGNVIKLCRTWICSYTAFFYILGVCLQRFLEYWTLNSFLLHVLQWVSTVIKFNQQNSKFLVRQSYEISVKINFEGSSGSGGIQENFSKTYFFKVLSWAFASFWNRCGCGKKYPSYFWLQNLPMKISWYMFSCMYI